jgi:hypothetical protein
MDSNFKVSIGMDDNAAANEGDYTRVNFDFEIQTQRVCKADIHRLMQSLKN